MESNSIIYMTISSVGSAAMVSFILKFLFQRFVAENDKKHQTTESSLQKTIADNKVEAKEVTDKLTKISENLALISQSVNMLQNLRAMVEKDHDLMIRADEWNLKYSRDLKEQFGKIRDIQQEVNSLKNIFNERIKGVV